MSESFVTPWTVARQAPLSMGFPRQECWSGLPFPFRGDLPDPGIESESPSLQGDSLLSETPGQPRPLPNSRVSWLVFRGSGSGSTVFLSGPPDVRQLRGVILKLPQQDVSLSGSLAPSQMERWTIALVRSGCNHRLGDLNSTHLFSCTSGDWKGGIKLEWLLRPLSLVYRWLPLEKEMATRSGILAGESHRQRRLAGHSLWSYTVRQDRSDLAHTHEIHSVIA